MARRIQLENAQPFAGGFCAHVLTFFRCEICRLLRRWAKKHSTYCIAFGHWQQEVKSQRHDKLKETQNPLSNRLFRSTTQHKQPSCHCDSRKLLRTMSRFLPQRAIHHPSRRHRNRAAIATTSSNRKDKNAPGVIVRCMAGSGIHTKSEEAVEIVTVLHPSSRTAVAVVFDISIAKNNDNGGSNLRSNPVRDIGIYASSQAVEMTLHPSQIIDCCTGVNDEEFMLSIEQQVQMLQKKYTMRQQWNEDIVVIDKTAIDHCILGSRYDKDHRILWKWMDLNVSGADYTNRYYEKPLRYRLFMMPRNEMFK